ncbi:MAG: class A beta-lactamase-related serine hydrolase [Actinobacteria bacterium]|nr:class A beta-lactamase-related serine hydrolase [Actinomycetota bacterium]
MIPVYSISKPFLAQAVLELDIPLQQQIGAMLPALPAVYASRSIESLLNHTSGLGDYTQLPEYRSAVVAGQPAWERDTLLALCGDAPHNHVGFHYSNIGFLLLRMLVEQQTSSSFFTALSQLVLDPLGITGFIEWELPTAVVPGYDPRWVYSGTLVAAPEAIAPAMAKLTEHRASTIGLSTGWVPVSHAGTGFDAPGYNFGFMTDGGSESEQPLRVGHGGSGPGFGLMALVDVRTGRSAVEYSGEDFDQALTIARMRRTLDG